MSFSGTTDNNIITRQSLQGYFFDSVSAVVRNQHIEVSDEIIYYLVNLLTTFSRSEDLFQYSEEGVSLKPLALMYSDAVTQTEPVKRIRILQRLGDTALFICGVFSDSLNKKLVDVDYYIAMGGSAYACLSDSMLSRQRHLVTQPVFAELTRKFVDFADVLSEVTEHKPVISDHDIMRLYEVWMRSGSKRAAQLLRKLGIDPVSAASPEYRH